MKLICLALVISQPMGENIMLSFVYRLVRDFEQEHGIQPNILYINEIHARHLKTDFAEDYSYQAIRDLLRMELVISREIIHPHVAWSVSVARQAG